MKTNDDIYETYKNWDMKNGIRGFKNPLMQKFLHAKSKYEINQLKISKLKPILEKPLKK